jgi:hypothetical protein
VGGHCDEAMKKAQRRIVDPILGMGEIARRHPALSRAAVDGRKAAAL